MDMREHVRDQAELAISYAEDGAYASAARVLRTLARETQAHADRVNVDMFDAGVLDNLAGPMGRANHG